MSNVNTVVFTIVVVLFVFVTFIGFAAARWRRAEDMLHLNEWGLGGRGFGTFVSWFLIGGDLYTAYTFIAVPALVYGVGSLGFFALPYTTIVYPLVFIFAPRFWLVAKNRNYITYADFARERFDSADRLKLLDREGVIGADAELRDAESLDQESQRGGVVYQCVVEQLARLLGGRAVERL